MTDIERDLEEVGRHVWPDPAEARLRLTRRGAFRRVLVRRAGRPGGAAMGAVAGLALVSTACAFVLSGHAGFGAAAPPPSDRSGAQAGRVLVPGPGGAPAGRVSGTPSAPAVATATAGQALPAASGHLSHSPPFTPLPSPGVQPGPVGGVLTLTQGSRGVFSVRPGMTVVVDLSGVGWSMPSSSAGQVVRFERGTAMPNGDVYARFMVVAAGEAKIQAYETLKSGPSILWQVQLAASP